MKYVLRRGLITLFLAGSGFFTAGVWAQELPSSGPTRCELELLSAEEKSLVFTTLLNDYANFMVDLELMESRAGVEGSSTTLLSARVGLGEALKQKRTELLSLGVTKKEMALAVKRAKALSQKRSRNLKSEAVKKKADSAKQREQGIQKHIEASLRDGRFEEFHTLAGDPYPVVSASLSPDGTKVITIQRGSQKGIVWDVSTGSELFRLAGRVDYADWSGDGTRIVTGAGYLASFDNKWYGHVDIWDARTGKELFHSEQFEGAIYSVQANSTGSKFVAGSEGGVIRIWDAATGKKDFDFIAHPRSSIFHIRFSSDGSKFVTTPSSNETKIWDVFTGNEVVPLSGHDELLSCAQFSPDGSKVITGSQDAMSILWDAKTGKKIRELDGRTPGKYRGTVQHVSFSPDGKKVVTTMDGWNKPIIWNTETGVRLVELDDADGATSAEFSPDGSKIVTPIFKGVPTVFDSKTGLPLSILSGHVGEVRTAEFSFDGWMIVTSGVDDKTAKIWVPEGYSSLSIEERQKVYEAIRKNKIKVLNFHP